MCRRTRRSSAWRSPIAATTKRLGRWPPFAGITVDDLPDPQGWAVETLALSTHNGIHLVTPAEIDADLACIGHVRQPLDIVVLNTRAGLRYGYDDHVDSGCGVGRDGTLHLLRQGVRIVGTDGWSWDAPFSATRERVARTGDASLVWEGHKAGREAGYCQIGKLAQPRMPSADHLPHLVPASEDPGGIGWMDAGRGNLRLTTIPRRLSPRPPPCR